LPKLQIPETYRRSIASLSDLSEEQVAAVSAALRSATKTKAAAIAASIAVPVEDAEQLLEAVLPFYSIPDEFGVTAEQFAEDVVDAVRSEWSERAPDDAAEAEKRFRSHLAQLTNVKEFSTLMKALSVLAAFERPFQSARVFTDLRPVFDEEVGAGVVGMGLVHNLKITYEGPDHIFEDLYVALTTADIRKLKEVLERAETKASQLRQQLGSTGIRYLEGE
jgi:hypothetical protein